MTIIQDVPFRTLRKPATQPDSPGPATAQSSDAAPRKYFDDEIHRVAKERRADLLLEFATDGGQQFYVSFFVVPLVGPAAIDFEEKSRVRQVTLRVSSPADRSVAAVVSVRYDHPSERLQDVVRDVGLGLDLVRQGKRNGVVVLTGKPGQLPKGWNKQRDRLSN